MEINIKLKFLGQQKHNQSVEVVRAATKQDLYSNQKQLPRRINQTQEDFDAQTQNLRSFREHRVSSNKNTKLTPRQVLTHRYSKSKEINLFNRSKKNQQKTLNQLHKKRIKESSKQKTSKNISQFVAKTVDVSSINKQSKSNLQNNFSGKFNGIDGKKILKLYPQLLNQIEKQEIINQKSVYYIGTKTKFNINEDDLEGNYIWQKHDHIGFRYELLEKLGQGTFGQVIKGLDHKTKEYVAVKIIKSKKQNFQLALNQINILMILKQKDATSQKNCVRVKDFIVFRKHMCIIFEMLSMSLYQLIKLNEFEGIKMDFIRRFAIQMLNALSFLKKNQIIHSDIKPENILLKSKAKTGIKLIDFGTSMFIHENNYDYIQSRYYRAPQVILGHEYGYPIDMWSTGCVLAELYTGLPLFSGDNQQQQLCFIMQVLGIPETQYLKSCKKCFHFFNNNLSPKIIKTRNGNVLMPATKPLNRFIFDKQFLDFLERILTWQPQNRLKPLQALMHPWILQGLPNQIKQQHLFYIQQQIKIEHQTKKQNVIQQKRKSTPKRKTSNNRKSQLLVEKKQIKKHMRRRSDGMY